MFAKVAPFLDSCLLGVDSLISTIAPALGTDGAITAFADGIGVVTENIRKSLPVLRDLFLEFEQISVMSFNIGKTVAIPLWRYSSSKNVQTLIKKHCPAWADVPIRDRGKYLGFIIGPGAGEESWTKPWTL